MFVFEFPYVYCFIVSSQVIVLALVSLETRVIDLSGVNPAYKLVQYNGKK